MRNVVEHLFTKPYLFAITGITDEMSAGGLTILSCLRELDYSRPYFVGLLGQRYGWHQERDGEDNLLTKSFKVAEKENEYPFNHMNYY